MKIFKSKFEYGWVILAACFVMLGISFGIRLSFGVFFQSLEQEFNWSRALTSGVFSVYMLVGAVFALLGGWIADRHGARTVFFIMGLATFAGLVLTGRANSLWSVFLSYSLLVAVGTGPIYVLSTSLTTRWFEKRRALAIGIVSSGAGLGSVIMAPVSSYLIEQFSWRTSFTVLGFIALLMVPCALLIRRSPQETKHIAEKTAPRAASSGLPLKEVVKTRNFKLLIVMWFFYAYCVFMVTTHIVRYAIDTGITPVQAASLLSLSGAANIPGRILGGILSERMGRKATALLSAGVMAASMILLTQSSTLLTLYIFSAIFGAAYGCLSPPTNTIVGDTFGVRNIGVVFGLLEIGWVSGAAAGPALAGYIFDSTDSYSLAFWLGVLAAVLIVVLVFFLNIPRKREGF